MRYLILILLMFGCANSGPTRMEGKRVWASYGAVKCTDQLEKTFPGFVECPVDSSGMPYGTYPMVIIKPYHFVY